MSKNAQARFCSDKHRNYFRRERLRVSLPAGMLERDRWVRWDRLPRKGVLEKKPLQLNGQLASSTDPATWSPYLLAKASPVGIGLGYVVGDGIACLDLDHCLVDGVPTAAAATLLARYPQNYIEVSPSGDGLHIWGTAAEASGSRRTVDGVAVERYSRHRYITVTGRVFQPGELLPL